MDNSCNINKRLSADVDSLVSVGRLDDALALLDSAIDADAGAGLYYTRGRLRWKLGRKTAAMADYARAVDLDPASPAAQALEMAREVMGFYHRDLYNP